jgi:hypothetical protein
MRMTTIGTRRATPGRDSMIILSERVTKRR